MRHLPEENEKSDEEDLRIKDIPRQPLPSQLLAEVLR